MPGAAGEDSVPEKAPAPSEGPELLEWLRRYVRLRWLADVVLLAGTLAGRLILGQAFPLYPLCALTVVIALYNLMFSLWERRLTALPPTLLLGRGRRFAFAQVIADLCALTLVLHYLGGVETPFFLFYLFHVGFGSIMLSRQDAYKVAALAIGLFGLLVVAEFLGWLPHVHLAGFVPAGLYRERAYVAAVLASFALTILVSTAGVTAIVGELRRQWEEQAQAREREIEAAGRRLAELDRMRDFFLMLASHDLKTPLAVVSNYLQTILDGFVGEVSERQRRWMERANARVLELIRLIDDFLDVAQLDLERIRDEMEEVAPGDVVKRSVEEVRPRAEEREITLRVELASRLPRVRAAPRRLQQVVTNLLDNAIKFSPRYGEVVIRVHPQDGGVQVEVIDGGPGIPALYMPHIFEDYFRVRRKEFVPGAGLGLSTARKIVECHGGEIQVESPYFADGKGSRFYFTLPGCVSESDDGNG
ncbi:MAG: HAMP domain-containing histidine kinase [Anaerolineae bacterium]|nr:HAMP domain-containing histidine kinase [Anaerolineae bacterium]